MLYREMHRIKRIVYFGADNQPGIIRKRRAIILSQLRELAC